MKALLVIVGLVVAAGAGAVGGAICTGVCPLSCPSDAVEVVQPPSVVTPGPAVMPAEAQQRMDALSMELGQLQAQIAALRGETSRAPAGVPAAAELASATPQSTDAFAAVHRDAILKVIDDRDAEIARKQAEERKQEQLKQNQARAERVSTKVPLSPGQKQLLTEFYGNERARFDEMRVVARDANEAGVGAPAREAFQAAAEWRSNELTRLFGTELAGQIRDAEGGDRRGAMGGGGGNGRRGGNGGNAGGAGPGQAAGGGG